MRRHLRPTFTPPVIVMYAGLFIYGLAALRIHDAFHSNGWDLGLAVQVIHNTGEGRWFEYTFRDINYLGDHFQPAIALLVPVLKLLGVEGLLLAQAGVLALAGAYLPYSPGWRALGYAGFAFAWVFSLGVAQAVSFDFHVEALAPLFIFMAWREIHAGHHVRFALWTLALLPLKEDAALAAVALCYLAWVHLGCRRWPIGIAGVALVYGFVVTAFVMPHYRGDDLNPFAERYAYLGDSPPEALRTIVTRPDVVLEHLAHVSTLETMLVLLGGTAFVALLDPKHLPALVLVTLPTMLSAKEEQATLQLHYLLVPTAMTVLIAMTNLHRPPKWLIGRHHAVPWVMAAATMILWAWKSPLPPSFAADMQRFSIDEHERAAAEMVKLVPPDARVSAQSHFVPHLAEREFIFQFPRVLDAEYVLVDQWGPKPFDDLAAGYDVCAAALPRLGFDIAKSLDGITLWQKRREAQYVPDVPVWCSGQRP